MSKVQHQLWFKRVIVFLALTFLPILVGLGFWQLDRAEQKQQLLDRWQMAPLLTELPVSGAEAGSRINLTGELDQNIYYLLDNRTREGRVGYEVIALFYPQNQHHTLLINLGWVAAPALRTQLPEIDLPRRQVQVSGRLIDPQPVLQLAQDHWGTEARIRIQQLNMQRLQERHVDLYPQVMQLNEPIVAGLKVGWKVVNITPQRHLGYSVQWFGLALVLLIGCLIMVVRGRREIMQ